MQLQGFPIDSHPVMVMLPSHHLPILSSAASELFYYINFVVVNRLLHSLFSSLYTICSLTPYMSVHACCTLFYLAVFQYEEDIASYKKTNKHLCETYFYTSLLLIPHQCFSSSLQKSDVLQWMFRHGIATHAQYKQLLLSQLLWNISCNGYN